MEAGRKDFVRAHNGVLNQSGPEGAGLSLWEPKGVEIKGVGESITVHIWFIHMFGYLKGFNGNAFYISYAH